MFFIEHKSIKVETDDSFLHLADLPDDFVIRQMRAEYKQQARLNDVICPARAVDENKTTVLLNDQKGEPYAVVEFK